MSQNAFDVGAPIPTVNAAVEARLLSALKSERVAASKVLPGPIFSQGSGANFSRADLIDATRARSTPQRSRPTRRAWRCCARRRHEYKYDIDLAEVAKIWRAGCIIRAALLSDVRAAFDQKSSARQSDARRQLLEGARIGPAGASRRGAERQCAAGIPVPALGSSLAYYDSYRSARLPANLTQGQRDFFGAHTYRRVDRDGVFHTDWTQA